MSSLRARHANCSVVGCTNQHKCLYSVPAKEEQKKQWVRFIFHDNIPAALPASLFVCANHFTSACFSNEGQYRAGFASTLSLIKGSLPTLRDPETAPRPQVQCMLCHAKLAYTQNTSSMLRHLRAKHGRELDLAPENRQQSPPASNPGNRKRDLDEALLRFIIKGSQSFSVVEDVGFKEFVAKLDPTYSLPTLKKVKQMAAARYDEEKKAKAPLQKPETASLTSDMWTSINTCVSEEELKHQQICEVQQRQVCIQGINSSLVQEDPEPAQIKEEEEELCVSEEGEQLVLKQEDDDFMVTAADEETDHSEDETLNFNIEDVRSLVEEKTSGCVPVQSSVVPEANDDQQLVSHNSDEAESQDQRGGKHGDSTSTTAEPEQNSHTMSAVHCDTHTGKTPFKCQRCKKYFQLKESLQRHMTKRTCEKSFRCKTCGKNFKYMSYLKIHTRIHTGEKPYICKICGKSFCQSNVKNHMVIHTGEKPFPCQICGKSFSLKNSLKVHMITHTGGETTICKTCGKTCRDKGVLRRHMRLHTGEKKVSCKTCGKKFRDNTCLIAHMRTHTGEKPFPCETCGKHFGCNSDLKVHMRIHTGEKPFLCKTCGKTFTRNCHLTIHTRTHTGEKPYPCKACGKRFKAQCDLRTHMKTHTDDRPYTCETCGKTYRRNWDLKVHSKSHTT